MDASGQSESGEAKRGNGKWKGKGRLQTPTNPGRTKRIYVESIRYMGAFMAMTGCFALFAPSGALSLDIFRGISSRLYYTDINCRQINHNLSVLDAIMQPTKRFLPLGSHLVLSKSW
jgi:hypothetical protein